MTKHEYIYNWVVGYFIPIVQLIIAIEDYGVITPNDPYIILHKRYIDAEIIFNYLISKVNDESQDYTEDDMNFALSTYITTIFHEEATSLTNEFQGLVVTKSNSKFDIVTEYARFFRKNPETAAVELIKALREKEEKM